jgi:hypothetical protein
MISFWRGVTPSIPPVGTALGNKLRGNKLINIFPTGTFI